MVMTEDRLVDWDACDVRHWDERPLALRHRLHDSLLFGRDVLARLIETHPPEDTALMLVGRSGDRARRWTPGTIDGLPGERVLDAIARGSFWLNLREVNRHDARYATLLASLYDEISAHVDGFSARSLKMGILVSSPGVHVGYHADLPGQMLWQIRGRKSVRLYPAQPPYLHHRQLEDIASTGSEFALDYDPVFESGATQFALEPGMALHWPLNSPHRIDNEHCVNISVTTEHWTERNRRSQRVHLANAVLRRHLGLDPRSHALDGPGYWVKSLLQAAWRRSRIGMAGRGHRSKPAFRLVAEAEAGFVEIGPEGV